MRSEQSDAVSDASRQKQDADARVRVSAFMKESGDGCVAVINYVGRVGARIVVLAPDGSFGDALASSSSAAEEICAALDLPVKPWDRDTTDLLAPSAEDRVKMGARRR